MEIISDIYYLSDTATESLIGVGYMWWKILLIAIVGALALCAMNDTDETL